MYWNDYSGGSASLGGCLDKKEFTLEELLDHDDILHEVKLQNKKLVTFLEETATIEKLINLVIKEPANLDDPANSYRYPALACEIIASGLPKLLSNIVNNNHLLKLLCSFLDSRPPLNPLLASFFAKTMQALLTRHCGQDGFTYRYTCLHVMLFAKCPTNRLLSKYLEHMGTSAIMDTLLFTIQIEEKEIKQDFLNWLDSQNFIEKLISIMCGNFDCIDTEHKLDILDKKREFPGFSNDSLNDNTCEREISPDDETKPSQDLINVEANPEVITEVVLLKEPLPKRLIIDISDNCASLLCEIICKENGPDEEYASDVFRQKCASPAIVEYLLKSMFEASPSNKQHTIINGIQVLLTILSNGPNMLKDYNSANNYGQLIQSYCSEEPILPILPYFPQLSDILLERPEKFQYGYSNGIEVPVGALRLSVIRLFEHLLNLSVPSVTIAFVNHNILSLLLDMLVEYQWNSCLHSSVTAILNKMLDNIQPILSIQQKMVSKHIFVDCALLDRIVKAWEDNDTSQKCNKPRAGYMGHLIKIANSVVDYLIMNPSIFDEVSTETKEKWDDLTKNHLDPINKIQNIYLGGQHPALVDNDSMHNQLALDDKDLSNSKFQIQEISCDDGSRDYDIYQTSAAAFESLCEKTSNSMGEDDATKLWWGRSPHLKDATDDEGNFQSGSKTPDEMAFYSIASKINDAKRDMKNYMMLQDPCVPDMSYIMQSFNNLSPWDANPSVPINNDEWADFSNCENIVNMAEHTNQSNVDPFAISVNNGEFAERQRHVAARGMLMNSSEFFNSHPFRESEEIENPTECGFQFTTRYTDESDEKVSDVMSTEMNDEMLSKMINNITLDVSTAGISSADENSNPSDKEDAGAQPSIVSNETDKTATCDSAENTSVTE